MDALGGFIEPTPSPAPASSSTPSSTTPSSSTQADMTTTQSTAREETTLDLDKEVQNVIAGFGSFWGKVRKQSTAAFLTAEKQLESTRKDLNPLLSKAKANLDHFSTAARAEVQRLSEVQESTSSDGGVIIGADGLPVVIGQEEERPPKLDKGKGVDRSPEEHQENPAAAASAFFSKIQSQLHSMQEQAPQALQALSSNFTQFQDQLSHLNLKNSTAEEYLHKGEHWLNEFKEEVSKLAKEAVQIVPPSISGQEPRKSDEFSLKTGMTRKDTLLHRLRTNSSILSNDPSLPPLPSSDDLTDHRAKYTTFVSTLPSASDLPESELVQAAREQGGEDLEQTKAKVTENGEISEKEFWKRYLFRVYLIEEEEEKRKKVLSVSPAEEEEFSWDMDDEEPNASSTQDADPSSLNSRHIGHSTPVSSAPNPVPSASKVEQDGSFRDVQSIASSITNQSPRTSSSEDTRTSFDMVGERSGNPSVDGQDEDEGKLETVERIEPTKSVPNRDEEDEDSDWE